MGLFGRLFGGGYQKKPGGGYDVGPGKKSAREFGRPLFGKPVATPAGKPVAVLQPITLGRSEPPTGQRTTVGVPHGLVTAFIAGTLTHVTSSWLKSAQYHQREQELEVWFLDGFHCHLEEVNETLAASFYDAPSKGGWWWDNVLGPGYIHGQPSTAAMRWH